MYRKILFVVFVFLTLGASAREFPLCMYGVSDPKDLPLLKKAGFTCVQSYQKDPAQLDILAQAAKKHGLQVVFYPDEIYGTDLQQKAASWPVLAWYLVDEPDVARWSRAQVQQTHQKSKQAWPKHATTLVIGQGKTRTPYYDIPDAMMMDWYPVPHLALTSFGDNVRWTKEGQEARGKSGAPLWGVVQIFNWKEFKQYRPDNDRIGRFPTQDEIRFMNYDGIVNGATGLFYFIFTSNGQPLPQAQPEWWTRVTAATKELAKLRPVLEKGTLTENPVKISSPLVMQTRTYKRHTYSILINRSETPQTVPAELLHKKYKALFGASKTAQIPPLTVWVLKK